MNYQLLFNLSIKYAPPKNNLRDAEILDAYGETTHANLAINHQHPNDVKRAELDYYGWIYAFMNFEDLLFYFYPIALEFEKDPTLDCTDSFLYSLNRFWKTEKKNLCEEDYLAVKEGILWMWSIGGQDYADFQQCKHLLNEIYNPEKR